MDEIQALVDRLKRHGPIPPDGDKQYSARRPRRLILPAAYDEGVRTGMEAVEKYAKELDKIK